MAMAVFNTSKAHQDAVNKSIEDAKKKKSSGGVSDLVKKITGTVQKTAKKATNKAAEKITKGADKKKDSKKDKPRESVSKAPTYTNPDVKDIAGIPVQPVKLLDEKALAADTAASDALQAYGLKEGDTEAAKYQLQQTDIAQKAAEDALAQQSASDIATAQARLAAKGGLSGGARERLNMAGQEQGIMGRQGLVRDVMGQKAGIRSQDETNKLNALQFAAPQKLAEAGYKAGLSEYNVGGVNRFNRDLLGLGLEDKGASALAAAIGKGPEDSALETFGGQIADSWKDLTGTSKSSTKSPSIFNPITKFLPWS
jgi:hypothetical protein